MQLTSDLGLGVSLIDAFDLGKERRTGSYVLHGEEITIIETSASPSIPYVLQGLKDLRIDPKEVRHIIVTHIHLDHAGGVGLLLESCPNANVIVHPLGKRHLANPEKLMLGARAVYREKFEELFEPILPVHEEKLITKQDGDTLHIGKDRTLTFFDTPGHAKHHFSIHDSFSNGIFTGDTIGVFYPQLKEEGIELILPSTSPNQFDPATMLHSLGKIEALNVERIYFGHYGMITNPNHVYEQIRFWLPKFMKVAEKAWIESLEMSIEKKHSVLFQLLFEEVNSFLAEREISLEGESAELIKLDLSVCTMGILDYLAKKER